MKKFTLLFSLLITIVSIKAQDYKISFEGTGASKAVDTIKIENLTQGKSMNLFGSEMLHLVGTITGLDPTIGDIDDELRIFPNPMTEYSTIEFVAATSGKTSIELFDITGKSLASALNTLPIGTHSFKVSGLSSGIYTLRINSPENIYTGKLVSLGGTGSEVKISYLENKPIAFLSKKLKSISAEKIMQYTSGDRLMITGKSGIYSTILVDVPTKSKTITFDFISCTDADGNNYPVVKIGNQIWMAENLKTTKYKNGNLIATTPVTFDISGQNTPKYQWAYDCIESNKNVYGRLYTWYAANDTGIIAPEGWRVPSYDDWLTLDNYLGGESVAGGKLKETGTLHWLGPNTGATNESGFSALPGGSRSTSEIFNFKGELGRWWSSTEANVDMAFGRIAFNTGTSLDHYSYLKNTGFSIRCVRNYIPVDSLGGKSAYNKDISPAGGEFVISGINDSINGISLSVPPNAFSGTHNFKIYAEPVPVGIIPDAAKPLSYLICINTDVGYSDSIITISVPVNLSTESSPMAFFFNPETNALEAIPTINVGENKIQFVLRRFSSLSSNKSASAFETIKLLILNFAQDKVTNTITSFAPPRDGWEFKNYGTYISPSGSCDGMCISAIWYYTEQHLKMDAPHLNGLLDIQNNKEYENRNAPYLNGLFDNLKSFGWDNPVGIKYTAYIHKLKNPEFSKNHEDDLIFQHIVNAIYTEKQPVLLRILDSDKFNAGTQIGHSLVAYAFDLDDPNQKIIYVYDPNTPNIQRSLVFYKLTKKFNPYESEPGQIYDWIFFIGKSSIIDYSLLNIHWVFKKSRPNYEFPDYTLKYEYNNAPKSISEDIVPLCSETVKVSLNPTDLNPTDLACIVYDSKGDVKFMPKSTGPFVPEAILCESSLSTFGFCILGINKEYYIKNPLRPGEKPEFSFIDFKWVTFKQEQYSIANVSEINQTGVLGQKLPNPIKVIVKDVLGNPFKDAKVNFKAKNGGSVSQAQVMTDKDGFAYVIWTLGPVDIQQTLIVEAFKSDNLTHLVGSYLTFTAKIAEPYEIYNTSGLIQCGSFGQTLRWPIKVNVKDAAGKECNGVKVNFTANNGGSVSHAQVITENGSASVKWTLGPTEKVQTLTVSAFKSDNKTPLLNSPLTITATAENTQCVNGTFTDPRDGHIYKCVKIGTQVWMAENLAYLPAVSPPNVYGVNTEHYYVYGYSGSDVVTAKQQPNYTTYGVLYNQRAAWYACPCGWHSPDADEWRALTNYLAKNDDGTYNYRIAKSLAATTNWIESSDEDAIGNNLSLNNKSGFSALPGGRYDSKEFNEVGVRGYWSGYYAGYYKWSLHYNSVTTFYMHPFEAGWSSAFSIRCIKE
jgi:uncharacterized protein (TIGR02145 family)